MRLHIPKEDTENVWKWSCLPILPQTCEQCLTAEAATGSVFCQHKGRLLKCTSFYHLSCMCEETYCGLLHDTDFFGIGNFGEGVRKEGEAMLVCMAPAFQLAATLQSLHQLAVKRHRLAVERLYCPYELTSSHSSQPISLLDPDILVVIYHE